MGFCREKRDKIKRIENLKTPKSSTQVSLVKNSLVNNVKYS
jgi:hypothetical protein